MINPDADESRDNVVEPDSAPAMKLRRWFFGCLAGLSAAVFVYVALCAQAIADHDTLPSSLVFVFGFMLVASFGGSLLACFTRDDELMTPVREKIGASWLVFAIFALFAYFLGYTPTGAITDVVAALITVQAMLGLMQSLVMAMKTVVFPRLDSHTAKSKIKQAIEQERRRANTEARKLGKKPLPLTWWDRQSFSLWFWFGLYKSRHQKRSVN